MAPLSTSINTFRTISGEWCAEVYVERTMLEVEYGPTPLGALEALWAKVARAEKIQAAGLSAVMHEVYRADPWREWRALGWRLLSLYRR